MIEILKTKLEPTSLKFIQNLTAFQQSWDLGADTQRDFYVRLQNQNLISGTGASTRIAGSLLTDAEIEARIVEGKFQKATTRDEAEAAGYYDCLKLIFTDFANLEISEAGIQALHKRLMRHLPESVFPPEQLGAYKTTSNSVFRTDADTGRKEPVFENTHPGTPTQNAMKMLLQHFHDLMRHSEFSDLEVIAAFIVKFLAIHPFRDGNGRLSRLLTVLCLLKRGYKFCLYAAHEKFIEASKDQYQAALKQTQHSLKHTPDLNPWFLHFLKVLEQQTRTLKPSAAPEKLGTFTPKEDIVFEAIKKYKVITIGFLARETGIKRVTLKSILSRLKQNSLIVMEGEKKSSRYRVKL